MVAWLKSKFFLFGIIMAGVSLEEKIKESITGNYDFELLNKSPTFQIAFDRNKVFYSNLSDVGQPKGTYTEAHDNFVELNDKLIELSRKIVDNEDFSKLPFNKQQDITTRFDKAREIKGAINEGDISRVADYVTISPYMVPGDRSINILKEEQEILNKTLFDFYTKGVKLPQGTKEISVNDYLDNLDENALLLHETFHRSFDVVPELNTWFKKTTKNLSSDKEKKNFEEALVSAMVADTAPQLFAFQREKAKYLYGLDIGSLDKNVQEVKEISNKVLEKNNKIQERADAVSKYKFEKYFPDVDFDNIKKYISGFFQSPRRDVSEETKKAIDETNKIVPKQKPKTKYTQQEIYSMLLDGGFNEQDAKIMSAVAMAESAGNARALNDKGRDLSYGLFQINMIGKIGPERRKLYNLENNNNLYDPMTNIRVAKEIFDKQGYGAWGAYTNESYKTFLDSPK